MPVVNGVPILAQPHRNKNANRCVIKCPSIAGLDSVRIKTVMTEQGVTEVDTGTFILSFTSKPPKSVKVGPLQVSTQHFIPRPILCRQCFCYGHTGEECVNKRACPKCAREHDGRCPGQPKCGSRHEGSQRTGCPDPIQEEEQRLPPPQERNTSGAC